MSGKGRTTGTPATGRYGGIQHSGAAAAVSYGDAEAESLKQAVVAVTGLGDALVFATTSDGGALSVRVLSDGIVTKWYPGDVHELESLLASLAAVG